MKHLILSVLIATGFTSVSNAQEKKETPPAIVSTAFNKAFPKASKVKWEKEKAGYEAGFVQNGKEMSAVYDSEGHLKETEVEINITELPQIAQTYLKTNYKNAAVKEATKITMADGKIVYEAELNKKDIIFDAKGNFMKVE